MPGIEPDPTTDFDWDAVDVSPTDSAEDADFQDGVALGRGEYEDSSTELNIEDVPNWLNPCLDWYKGRPVFYLYDAHSEESVYMIALPTASDPTARLIKARSWYSENWKPDE